MQANVRLNYLSPENGYLFRLIHIDNLEWDLRHGCHSRNSVNHNPNYESIGIPALINRRTKVRVPINPYGVLSDYVPFYFTPLSPMQFNILTGYNQVAKRCLEELVILATSVNEVRNNGCTFVYTDRHAVLAHARFASELDMLSELPWEQLRAHNFRHDSENSDKAERYQAEGLVHKFMPSSAIIKIGYPVASQYDRVGTIVAGTLGRDALEKVAHKPEWFF